ncbi:EamA family transporter [Sphingobacterium rhinopitheci]|uniref:EamA family transporter n=1 Tax=Sphingobacterium rhinopitheci TaxID=2781960 RepID=UPI001F521215|nr:EamA family transporter [Sphingobacterium rhinopitheci]MCI0920679.1 EamA family transporter [Sphingobacterium rhinopitheci]
MQLKYYAAALFSFVVWGCFSLVLKPLSDYEAMDILVYRVGFAAIIIVSGSLLFRWKITKQSINQFNSLSPSFKQKAILHAIVSAVALAFNWYLYIYVMNDVSVKATSLAYLICPILTTVLAALFLKEKLHKWQWFAVILSVISCLILSLGYFIDMFYSIIIALSYAVYIILQKVNIYFDRFFTLTIHIVISALILVPYGYSGSVNVVHSNLFYELVLLIAVLFTIVPLFLNMYALKGLSSSIVGVLLYINPIIAFLLAIFYFKETINLNQVLAYTLIFIAVIIFNITYLRLKNEQSK